MYKQNLALNNYLGLYAIKSNNHFFYKIIWHEVVFTFWVGVLIKRNSLSTIQSIIFNIYCTGTVIHTPYSAVKHLPSLHIILFFNNLVSYQMLLFYVIIVFLVCCLLPLSTIILSSSLGWWITIWPSCRAHFYCYFLVTFQIPIICLNEELVIRVQKEHFNCSGWVFVTD